MLHQDLFIEKMIENEIMELRNAGVDPQLVDEIESKADLYIRNQNYQNFLNELEKIDWTEHKRDEPSDYEAIVAQLNDPIEFDKSNKDETELFDRIYGAWLARCAGCTLGKPVEGWHHTKIKEYLTTVGAFPLTTYIPEMKKFPEGLSLHRNYHGTTLGNIEKMVRDDDIDYTVMSLLILETFGRDFTTMNVGETWLRSMPFFNVFTAEAVAYKNMVNEITPPRTAWIGNPYREFIGAQIRADMWGYVNPGDPMKASEFAFRDASLSHLSNGIYGEMWASASIAAAYCLDRPKDIVQAGLSYIPPNSRLAQAIRKTLGWCQIYRDWESTLRQIVLHYSGYHFAHVINNTCIIVMGLLYGEGDLEKTLCITLMGGYDTDCTCATAGSIVGMMKGASALPDKWIGPLNDRLESMVMGFGDCTISDLAKRTKAFVNY